MLDVYLYIVYIIQIRLLFYYFLYTMFKSNYICVCARVCVETFHAVS